MRKALLVSYVFPPMAAVGGQRVLYFCRYLRDHDWEPVVLTVRDAVNMATDPTLLEKIPDTRVYRSRTFEPLLKWELSHARPTPAGSTPKPTTGGNSAPARPSLLARLKRMVKLLLSVPDHAIFWVPFGVVKGLSAIRKEKPDVIFSSSPPVSSHLVASILSRLTSIPHVVDFRDLWTLNHLYEQRNYPAMMRSYDRFWERFVLRRAAALVTASPGFTRQMEDHCRGRYSFPIESITNGFDYAEVQGIKVRPDDGRFHFLYVGSLYADFNPEFFFRGLATWIKQRGLDETQLAVDFYGNTGFDYSAWLKEIGLDRIVKFHGFKSRSELLPLLLSSDCLLLFLGFNPVVRNVIPAKLFEYLASGTPILAITPEGVTSGLIKRFEAGLCISEENESALVSNLESIYEARRETVSDDREFMYHKDIDRASLTEKLATVFDQVVISR